MILSCLLNVGELIWGQTHTLDLKLILYFHTERCVFSIRTAQTAHALYISDLAASEDSLKTLTGDL